MTSYRGGPCRWIVVLVVAAGSSPAAAQRYAMATGAAGPIFHFIHEPSHRK